MSGKTRNLEWRQRDNEYAALDTKTQVLATTTDTCEIDYPLVKLDSSAGAVTTLTVPDGKPGQILVLQSIDANNIDVIPTTSFGFTTIALDVIGDTCVLLWANDTAGWIILSLFGVAGDANPAYVFE